MVTEGISIFNPSFTSFKLGLKIVQPLKAKKFLCLGSTDVGIPFALQYSITFEITFSVNTPLL